MVIKNANTIIINCSGEKNGKQNAQNQKSQSATRGKLCGKSEMKKDTLFLYLYKDRPLNVKKV
jgi:hypothetical protein